MLPSLIFLRPARRQLVRHAEMIQHPGDDRVHDLRVPHVRTCKKSVAFGSRGFKMLPNFANSSTTTR